MTGCAPAPSPTTVRPEPEGLGRIGIISPAMQPGTEIGGLPPRGTADGAIAGTAAGSLVGAFECLPFLFPPPAYPVCIAVLAAAGLGAGVVMAESQDIVADAQEKFSSVLTERDWQALLRQRIIKLAAEEYSISVVNLGAPRLQAVVVLPAGTEQKPVLTQPVETAYVTDEVPSVLSVQADTLMEVALVKLSTWFSGDHKFGFVLTGQAQLVRTSDLVVLASTTHYYVSPSLPLTDWINRDGALIGDSVADAVDYLAQEIVREQLHAP